VLHSESSSAHQAREQYGWDTLADREGFVVAYPDSAGGTWNVSPTCCGPSHDQGTNDVGFLHQLVSAIGKSDFIGRSRVYAVGFSTGATLAYSWACSLPGELAGIGAVAGSLVIGCPILAPITLAVVHGSNDHIVPIGGGADPRAGTALQHHPLEATLTLFRTLDRCPDQPSTTTGPPVSQRSWSCVAGNSVSVAIIDQAGHQWPGATPPAEGAQPPTLAVDQPSTALNATDWLWTHLRDARSH
jgi:polyhydroxybutyrate depolymerase